jgi:uncharacterized protein YkwD
MTCKEGIISLLAVLVLSASVAAQQEEKSEAKESKAPAAESTQTKDSPAAPKKEAEKKEESAEAPAKKVVTEKTEQDAALEQDPKAKKANASPKVTGRKAPEMSGPSNADAESASKEQKNAEEPAKEKTAPEPPKTEKKQESEEKSPRVVNGVELSEVEYEVYQKTNAQRARYGLPPLVLDGRLMQSARRHCRWMARRRVMQHTRANVAENIAMGQRSSGHALRSWMSSSGHRANILKRSYRRIGVAAYRSANGTIFWCQQFLY